MRPLLLAVTVIPVTLLVGCGVSGGPEVSGARMGAPTGPNAALYFTATAEQADRLIEARTTIAREIQIHESTTGSDGTTGMRPVEGLDLASGGTLVFEPGGYHLMLLDVGQVELGDEVEVTLVWENAGESTISAQVVEPGDTIGHDG